LCSSDPPGKHTRVAAGVTGTCYRWRHRKRNSRDGWWWYKDDAAGPKEKAGRMGRRRSGGTGTPAMRYLYMSACCSSSAHCAAVKTAAPRGCCWCGYPPTLVAAELSIGAATLLLLAPRSLPKQSEERMQEEDVRWGLVEGSWWRPLSEEEEDEGREGSVVALAAGCFVAWI
jgi:hypothetical protein